VYDYSTLTMYVSFAAADGDTGPLPAYSRPFVALDMPHLWNESPPTLMPLQEAV
jgi:hypothetical protein